jgi:hypothetical protein
MRGDGWRARRGAAVALSLAGHLALGAAAVFGWRAAPAPPEPPPIVVALVTLPAPIPSPAPQPLPRPAREEPTPRAGSAAPKRPSADAPAPARPSRAAAPALLAAAPTPGAGLSDADLAGAARAGDGGGGGACDMARRLQAALRRDPMVNAAAASATLEADGRALLVWNGDWVQSGGDNGKGLQVVREAVAWEVAFAPPACRAAPVRGLVLLTLGDQPGAARIALGSDQWRWSDLLKR